MKRFTSPSAPPPDPADEWAGPVVDCHQHAWPHGLVEALRRRTSAPRLTGWTLHLDGEAPFEVTPADHDLKQRGAIDVEDGVDLTLLSLSSPLGIETLPPSEAEPLLAAWRQSAAELPATPGEAHPAVGMWAGVGLVDPDLEQLAADLRHDRVVGLQLPATALADPRAVEELAPVLEVVQAADRPVLVHPGPAGPGDGRGAPGWWPALADYPAQQARAWFAWHVAGRTLLPTLRIAYVGLAGLAPLHHERLAQRGGTLGALDPLVFYETSSYGTRAVDAMTRVVGVDPLVHGSDRPYALPTDPGLGGAFGRALHVTNPHHLMKGGRR